MNVFLTGASGFIGSHVAKTLLERGHNVAVLVMPDDPMPRLQDMGASLEILRGTLGDAEALEKFFYTCRPEACIHLAWYAEPGKYLEADQNIQSLTESLSLFKRLIAAGCRQIVGAGTCFEYDTNFGFLREETPALPASLYAAAKLSCYLTGSRMASNAGVPFAWGRIFYPFGPLEDPRRLVPAAIAALKEEKPFAASPGQQVRDYIHVADVAAAFCVLAEKQAEGIFNISTGNPVSIRQLLETIGALMNRADLIQLGALPYRNWEPPFICGCNARLRNLGWNPRYLLEEGLLDTIQKSLTDVRNTPGDENE